MVIEDKLYSLGAVLETRVGNRRGVLWGPRVGLLSKEGLVRGDVGYVGVPVENGEPEKLLSIGVLCMRKNQE